VDYELCVELRGGDKRGGMVGWRFFLWPPLEELTNEVGLHLCILQWMELRQKELAELGRPICQLYRATCELPEAGGPGEPLNEKRLSVL
jgi:hypothetical protein